MAIIGFQDLRTQLRLTSDAPAEDDAALYQKAEAAQNHIERLLGFKIEERFGGTDQDPIPPALCEAVLQLAAWWFENREAAGNPMQPMPYGVAEIVAEYRDYTF